MAFEFPVAPEGATSSEPGAILQALRQVAKVVNRSLAGKLNATGTVTLTANAATTVISDARFTVQSFVNFDPLTANASTEKANGTIYVTAANRRNSQFTVTHANNAQTDRTFRYLIIG